MKIRRITLLASLGLLCKSDGRTNGSRKPDSQFDSSIEDSAIIQRKLQDVDYFSNLYYFYHYGQFNKDYDENQKIFEEDIELPVSLSEFNSDILGGYDTCDDFVKDLEQALAFTANKIINRNMHLRCGYYDDYYDYCTEILEAYGNDGDESSISEDGFETNKQHEDVDEADVVKSDGTFVYAAYGGEIIVSDLKGTILDRLRVSDSSDASIVGLLIDVGLLIAFLSGNSVTKIVKVSVNANGELTKSGIEVIKGSYKTARMIDSTAYVITSSEINTAGLTEMLDRTYNERYFKFNDVEYAHDAKAKAIAAIPSTAQNILRDVLLLGEEDVIAQGACKMFPKIASYPSLSSKLDGVVNGFVRVTSFGTSSNLRGADVTMNQVAAFVPSNIIKVYMNKEMLFVASKSVDDDVTYITSFLLSDALVTPHATGVIPGVTLNQFSFDFYENHLRVATTTRHFGYSTNQVIVAKIADNEIKIVGRLNDLGTEEEIYAVRFLGDCAFVVTFRLVDPFYTIDLSVPENPTLKGELKIPGFSNYLHPIGDHIIAVGQDADDGGTTLGLQVSLFDVTDLTNPIQTDKYVVEGYSSSASQYDHYAFRYLPKTRKLVLPLSVLPGKDSIAHDGFYIFDIKTKFDAKQKERGIDLDFTISHYESKKSGGDCFGAAYLQPRSLVFGENLITLKGHSMQSHNIVTQAQQFDVSFDSNSKKIECLQWFVDNPGQIGIN